MFKYTLPLFFIVILLFSRSCVLKRKTINTLSDSKKSVSAKKIEIVFKLNKNDYSYSFTFVNLSNESFFILYPQTRNIANTGGYFKLLDDKLTFKNSICTTLHGDVLSNFIELEPGKKTIIESVLTLNQLFCKIDTSNYLAYSYSGFFKEKYGAIIGGINFDFQPTKINLLDSLVITKYIF